MRQTRLMNPSLEPGQPGEPLEGGDVVLGVVERRTTLVRLPLLRHLEEGRFLSCKDTNRCIYFLSLKLFCHPNTPGQRLRELNFSPVSFDHLGYILFHESQGCVGGGGGIHGTSEAQFIMLILLIRYLNFTYRIIWILYGKVIFCTTQFTSFSESNPK